MRALIRRPLAAAALALIVGCRAGAPAASPADTSASPGRVESPRVEDSRLDDSASTGPATPSDSADAAPEPTAFSGTTGRTDKAGPPAAPGMPRLRAVRTASHDDFDRIVFEFDGSDGQPATVPGYRIGYEAAPTRCGSGDAVAVGGAALVVEMQPTAAHTDAGQPTLSVRRLTPGHESVRALEQTCDFEALVAWTVGVAARRPYRVRELAAPARLVVDVSHTPR